MAVLKKGKWHEIRKESGRLKEEHGWFPKKREESGTECVKGGALIKTQGKRLGIRKTAH